MSKVVLTTVEEYVSEIKKVTAQAAAERKALGSLADSMGVKSTENYRDRLLAEAKAKFGATFDALMNPSQTAATAPAAPPATPGTTGTGQPPATTTTTAAPPSTAANVAKYENMKRLLDLGTKQPLINEGKNPLLPGNPAFKDDAEKARVTAAVAAAPAMAARIARELGVDTATPSAEILKWQQENNATMTIRNGVIAYVRTGEQSAKENQRKIDAEKARAAELASTGELTTLQAQNKETERAINAQRAAIDNPSAGPTPPITSTISKGFNGITGAIGRFAEYTGMPRGIVDFFSDATKGLTNFAVGTAMDWKAEKNPMMGVLAGIIGLFAGSWGSGFLASIPVIGPFLASGVGKFAITAAAGMLAFKAANDYAGVGSTQTEPALRYADRNPDENVIPRVPLVAGGPIPQPVA